MALPDNPSSRDLELLSAYIDDELTSVERAALEARLERDPALRRELDEMRVVVQALNNLPPLRAPRDFTLTPEMVAPRREEAAVTFFFFPTSAAFSAITAAAATLLIVFGAVLLLIGAGQADFAAPPAAMEAGDAPAQAPVAAQPTNTPAPLFASTILPSLTMQPTLTVTAPPPTTTPALTLPAAQIQLEGAAEPSEIEEAEADFAGGAAADEDIGASLPTPEEVQDQVPDAAAESATFPSPSPPPQATQAAANRFAATETVIARVLPTTAARSAATAVPAPPAPPESAVDVAALLSFGAIALGVVLAGVAIGTTITRRRNRRGPA